MITCAYCGRRATCRDHIRPKSRGGSDQDSNLAASCTECNSSKGDRLITEWIPARVLRAVAVEPKVYAELLRIRGEVEQQLSARHLAAAEATFESRAAILTDLERTRRPVGLREAVKLGIVPSSLEAVRKAQQRDPEFPRPIMPGKIGIESLYDADELRVWAAWRPQTGGAS
jgi:hypothetical protein